MAVASSPVGAPPPLGLIVVQKMPWLRKPPPLLRTAVCLSSGSALRSASVFSMG